jgi:hypothetical protein
MRDNMKKGKLTLQTAIQLIGGAADGTLQGCHLNRKEAEAVMGALYSTIDSYITNHKAWSVAAFGEGDRTAGLLKHIAKELEEVAKEPTDVMEWVDIIILAIDGAWRATGLDPAEIAAALQQKQAINKARRWPVPVDGQPTEHIREE